MYQTFTIILQYYVNPLHLSSCVICFVNVTFCRVLEYTDVLPPAGNSTVYSVLCDIMQIDLCNEVEQWYVRHNYFIVLYHRLHVSTYIQVIFWPSFKGKSIKCYTCWDPIMLTVVTVDLPVKEGLKMTCI